MVFPLEINRHVDPYRLPVRRTKLRYEARTILQLDQHYRVRDRERRMGLVMHDCIAIHRSSPGRSSPLECKRPASRADRRDREPKSSAVTASLKLQLVAPLGLPERHGIAVGTWIRPRQLLH